MGNVQTVSVKDLDYAVEFDVPFALEPREAFNAHVSSSYAVSAHKLDSGLHAPSVHVDGEVDRHGDIHVNGKPTMDGGGWSFFSCGYSGQYGQLLTDPVMHDSEYLGGKLARDMIEEGGTFVVTEVVILAGHGPDLEYQSSGWVVLRKDDDV